MPGEELTELPPGLDLLWGRRGQGRRGPRPGLSADMIVDAGIRVADAWHFLPPWPDSVAGIGRIKRDFIVGPLSNGNTALLVDMAKGAALAWDVVLGSDIGSAYKPSADAYLTPARILGLEPGELMLVAAHNADLASARQVGLATGYVPRPAELGPHQHRNLAPTADWDVIATSITDLADRLAPTPQ